MYKKKPLKLKKYFFNKQICHPEKKSEILKMSTIIIPFTLIYWNKRKEIIMKRHGYNSYDEGLINILMKEKYLKKLIMKENVWI